MVKGHHVDILVFTGDFCSKNVHNFSDSEIASFVKEIINAVGPTIGAFGVLGNHDHSGIVTPLEEVGLKLLINEAVDIKGKILRSELLAPMILIIIIQIMRRRSLVVPMRSLVSLSSIHQNFSILRCTQV